MSVSPTTSGNSASQQVANTGGQTPPSTTQKAAETSKTAFGMFGLSICKQHKNVCAEGLANGISACYSHIGVGNIVSRDNKIYILTVAHLFSSEPEEYMLVKHGELFFPFKHACQTETVDATFIPVYEVNPQDRSRRYLSNSSFQGSFHLHS